MSKDPAFLFYPGDYLRDTQTLSEKAQVSYDRIMCEHMRNICISKQQLKFFTKKLNEEELEELMFVLKEFEGGYQIEWIAESIVKRRNYSESRRNNRKGKKKEHMLSHDEHMENENENEIKNKPTIEDIKAYTLEKGYEVDANKIWHYYNDNNWRDAKGKEVRNWKTKILNNWCKEENKIKEKPFSLSDYQIPNRDLFGYPESKIIEMCKQGKYTKV